MNWALWLVVGAVAAWIGYRAGRWSERRGVLAELDAELLMHANLVGTPYGELDRGTWSDPDYVVYKLSTVAVDNAIVRGPALFLNKDLGPALVRYRQVISQLNQMIDRITNLQVAAVTGSKPRPPDQVKAAIQLLESVHLQGIGDHGTSKQAGAHVFHNFAQDELRREQDSIAVSAVWAVSGLNLSSLNVLLDLLVRPARRALGGPVVGRIAYSVDAWLVPLARRGQQTLGGAFARGRLEARQLSSLVVDAGQMGVRNVLRLLRRAQGRAQVQQRGFKKLGR